MFIEILQISKAAYTNTAPIPVNVPQSWLDGFGPMTLPADGEDPEALPVEVQPASFKEYIDFLRRHSFGRVGHPGGVTHFLRKTDEGWERDKEAYDFAFPRIPWDLVREGADIGAMKEDLADLLAGAGETYHGRVLSVVQWKRDFAPFIREEEV